MLASGRGAEIGSWGASQGWGHSPLSFPSRAAGEPEASEDYVKVRAAQSLFHVGQNHFLSLVRSRDLTVHPQEERVQGSG